VNSFNDHSPGGFFMRLFLIPCLFIAQFAFAGGPCAADREKLCAGVEKGGGQILKCLKENEAQLSTQCKAHRESMKGAMKDIHDACEADVESLCGDTKKGKGRIMKCLKKNRDQVSEACKAELMEKKGMRKNKKYGG